MSDLPIIPSARYYPVTAVAFAAAGGDGVTVDALNPLPVGLTFGASGATPLSGSVSASGLAGPFASRLGRPIWLTLSGVWAGTVMVRRSIDGGASKHPLTAGGAPWGVFTGNACEQVVEESEAGATYYLDATLTSGTLTYRVSQ